MTDSKPAIAQKSPIKVQVEAGKTYHWCACGNSKNQPMCDGAHKGTGFTPMAYTADVTGENWFCACNQSKTAPCATAATRPSDTTLSYLRPNGKGPGIPACLDLSSSFAICSRSGNQI